MLQNNSTSQSAEILRYHGTPNCPLMHLHVTLKSRSALSHEGVEGDPHLLLCQLQVASSLCSFHLRQTDPSSTLQVSSRGIFCHREKLRILAVGCFHCIQCGLCLQKIVRMDSDLEHRNWLKRENKALISIKSAP